MYPFEFELLYWLAHRGPQAASELLADMAAPQQKLHHAQGIGTRLAGMAKRGLVERKYDGDRIWQVTDRGRRIIDT